MKTAFLYSDEFAMFDYGASHPLKPFRLKLTYELIKACGLFVPGDPRIIVPEPASIGDLLSFHSPEYIEILQAANRGMPMPGSDVFGLGPGDNPIFPGMFDWSRLIAGASLKAADVVDSGEADAAFNISGGLHHAMADHASGFCYINDPVLAIKRLVDRGRRVAYIDIDAHHGDGVQAAFYDTDKVLTISLHETGEYLFPGTGFEHETGEGKGNGYSVNVPLPPEADDELFISAFTGVVPRLVESFKPDIVVSQLGVDTFRSDPLTHLNMTTGGFCRIVGMIKSFSPKWVALGGGGYDIANVARAWTLAWAIMNNVNAPDEIPEDFISRYAAVDFHGRKLRDEPFVLPGPDKEVLKKEVERIIAGCRARTSGNAC
jgi:acetoin utilization protein AcuC